MARLPGDRRGIYDNDHFSGAQVSLYIGDVWVDEVTSLSFNVSQKRYPVYGYASQYFDAVASGNILVEGQFSINFKEAGYLWLILNRHKKMMGVAGSRKVPVGENEYFKYESAIRENIEQIVSDRPRYAEFRRNENMQAMTDQWVRARERHLTGFASASRDLNDGMGKAENIFEAFENLLWRTDGNPMGAVAGYDAGKEARRADANSLNPFDIYIQYGDYVGDDRIHHTLQKLETVYIVGTAKQIVISGEPIQESYQFIARNLL